MLQMGTGKTRNEEMGNGKRDMGNEETEIGNGLETKPKTLKTFA